jgi:hypothetical protein
MKRLVILFLLALPTFAQAPREIFPSDYKPQACAEDVCTSFPRAQLAQFGAAHRKLQLEQDWIDAHWDEMTTVFRPICAKIGNCLAVPGNDWLFCTDFLRWEFIATADRYPAGSKDYEQWQGSALMFYIGLKNAIVAAEPKSQACARAQAAPAERKLEAWTKPARIGPDYDGFLTVYAIDAETRIPVKAHITIEGQTLLPAYDSPDGSAMSFYRFRWPVTLNPVPNADGHRDLVVPNAIITAEGYPVTTLPIPYEVPKVIIEMQPPASKLKRGTNAVTVTARDAATGQPVELRVMAGTRILGNTNKPLTLEITGKRPEIWATSLFHRYSDMVVAKAQ